MKRLTGQRLLRHCFDPKRQQDDGDARLTPARSASTGIPLLVLRAGVYLGNTGKNTNARHQNKGSPVC